VFFLYLLIKKEKKKTAIGYINYLKKLFFIFYLK
jgi:hypothetical protein